MSRSTDTCAVCGASGLDEGGLSRVVIEGRGLGLCRSHAAMVASEMPDTFEELRKLFVGLGTLAGRALGEERRSPISRREPEDRRVFPPRPEGRRMSTGRRATDPME